MSEDILTELTEAIRQNTEINRALLLELRRDRATWLGPDEACERLGFGVTKSGKHRARLTWLRQKGFLRTFGSHRPYSYCAKEVDEVAAKMRAGRLVIPSSC